MCHFLGVKRPLQITLSVCSYVCMPLYPYDITQLALWAPHRDLDCLSPSYLYLSLFLSLHVSHPALSLFLEACFPSRD